MKYLKDEKANAAKLMPKQGFVGVGSVDENWGWLSTYFLNRTATWQFDFLYPPKPPCKLLSY